jgi:amino acid transporter
MHQVSLDAFFVLCGSVLTSYVGVVGLARRMAQDRHLPAALLGRNRTFGTNHTIIFGFFGLCCLLFVFSQGDVLVLGSVYAISFLCVMALFAIGALALMRSARTPMRLAVVAPILAALAAVVVAVIVNGFIFAAKLGSRF